MYGFFNGRQEEDDLAQKKAKRLQYVKELEAQMQEKEQRKRREAADQEAFDKRFEAEAAEYDALGQRARAPAPGAAPQRQQGVQSSAPPVSASNQGGNPNELRGDGRAPFMQQHGANENGIGGGGMGGGGLGGGMGGNGNGGIGGNGRKPRITQPLEDAVQLRQFGERQRAPLARYEGQLVPREPVVVGYGAEEQLQRLLEFERDRARERERDRERERERERERDEARQRDYETQLQRQREWDKRQREEEAERHAKAERLMVSELDAMRRDFVSQHRGLVGQVEEQLTRLRALSHAYAPTWLEAKAVAPRDAFAPPLMPPLSSDAYGHARHDYSAQHEHRAHYPGDYSRGLTPLGMVKHTPGSAHAVPHGANTLRPQSYGTSPRSGGSSEEAGDELDRLLTNFLKQGTDLRGSQRFALTPV